MATLSEFVYGWRMKFEKDSNKKKRLGLITDFIFGQNLTLACFKCPCLGSRTTVSGSNLYTRLSSQGPKTLVHTNILPFFLFNILLFDYDVIVVFGPQLSLKLQ